ncbi:MAG: Uma2 family endonuclease [Spirosomataceae bacterium]
MNKFALEKSEIIDSDMSSIAQKIYKTENNLPQIIEELQRYMQDEQNRRLAFYDWVDDSMKAEFILGEIVVHSPALEKHTSVRLQLTRLLSLFAEENNLGLVRDEKAMVHLTRNSYEPDICFWSSEKSAQFKPETSIYPAPDLVVEILSKHTKRNDRGIKFDDYFINGVHEYWIIDPNKQVIEQYYISPTNDKKYTLFGIWDETHEIESRVVKGFKIPVLAAFDAEANRQAIKNLL